MSSISDGLTKRVPARQHRTIDPAKAFASLDVLARGAAAMGAAATSATPALSASLHPNVPQVQRAEGGGAAAQPPAPDSAGLAMLAQAATILEAAAPPALTDPYARLLQAAMAAPGTELHRCLVAAKPKEAARQALAAVAVGRGNAGAFMRIARDSTKPAQIWSKALTQVAVHAQVGVWAVLRHDARVVAGLLENGCWAMRSAIEYGRLDVLRAMVSTAACRMSAGNFATLIQCAARYYRPGAITVIGAHMTPAIRAKVLTAAFLQELQATGFHATAAAAAPLAPAHVVRAAGLALAYAVMSARYPDQHTETQNPLRLSVEFLDAFDGPWARVCAAIDRCEEALLWPFIRESFMADALLRAAFAGNHEALTGLLQDPRMGAAECARFLACDKTASLAAQGAFCNGDLQSWRVLGQMAAENHQVHEVLASEARHTFGKHADLYLNALADLREPSPAPAPSAFEDGASRDLDYAGEPESSLSSLHDDSDYAPEETPERAGHAAIAPAGASDVSISSTDESAGAAAAPPRTRVRATREHEATSARKYRAIQLVERALMSAVASAKR